MHESAETTPRPSKPTTSDVKSDSLRLSWPRPTTFSESSYFKVRYKDTTATRWKSYPDEPSDTSLIIKGLTSDTTYVFQVRVVDDEDEGPFSPTSDTVTTRSSPALRLKASCVMIKQGQPSVYKIPATEIKEARNDAAKTRKLQFGRSPKHHVSEKTIMFVGGTGAGKSTMVDAILNYVLAVNWDDPFRFTFVDLEKEESDRKHNEALSQTEWITCYTLNPEEGNRIDYKLHILDTPGFGDARGLERDNEIVAQLQQLFSAKGEKGILCIDAVCFLIKASDARLTATLKYIFHSMVSVFGKDIESNVCTCITFSDGDNPKVLPAMKEAQMPDKVWYPFNNSCVSESNINLSETNMYAMSWDMGYKSCNKFFDFLDKTTTKSLQLTQDVLKERQVLDLTIHNVQKKVNAGLEKLNEFKKEMAVIEQHKLEIESNKDFEYEVPELRQTKAAVPKGKHTTTCTHCHFTCHENCALPNDNQKEGCVAMYNGNCTQCEDKCHWTKHANTPYIIRPETVIVKKTYFDKLKKYQEADQKMMSHAQLAEKMKAELDALETSIEEMMKQVNECSNTLKRIALRPSNSTLIDYIDIMIENEKFEKKDGYMEKIQILREYRQRAEIHKDVARLKSEYDSIDKSIFST